MRYDKHTLKPLTSRTLNAYGEAVNSYGAETPIYGHLRRAKSHYTSEGSDYVREEITFVYRGVELHRGDLIDGKYEVCFNQLTIGNDIIAAMKDTAGD